jgi:hypothetical protein
MAKIRRQPKKSGPHLAAAFFCDEIIADARDHALCAIRIVDTFRIVLPSSAPKDLPSETNRLPVPVSGLLSFKTGDSRGQHVVKLVSESPSGKKQPIYEQSFTLGEEPTGGVNIRIHQTILVKRGGVFWLHVYLDGKRVTRMPFQILVSREGDSQTQSSDGQGNEPVR